MRAQSTQGFLNILEYFLAVEPWLPPSLSFSLAAATFLLNVSGSNSSDVIYKTRKLIKEKH